jgi:hypothetical protein
MKAYRESPIQLVAEVLGAEDVLDNVELPVLEPEPGVVAVGDDGDGLKDAVLLVT